MTAPYRSMKRNMDEESLGQFSKRVRSGGRRPPLRSIRELAEEFGVSLMTLSRLMQARGGPKALYSSGSPSNRNTWFNPTEVRKWWSELEGKK